MRKLLGDGMLLTCAKVSLVSRTHARISHLSVIFIFTLVLIIIILLLIHNIITLVLSSFHFIFVILLLIGHIILIIITCPVLFPDNWVEAVEERRGQRRQDVANLFARQWMICIVFIWKDCSLFKEIKVHHCIVTIGHCCHIKARKSSSSPSWDLCWLPSSVQRGTGKPQEWEPRDHGRSPS